MGGKKEWLALEDYTDNKKERNGMRGGVERGRSSMDFYRMHLLRIP